MEFPLLNLECWKGGGAEPGDRSYRILCERDELRKQSCVVHLIEATGKKRHLIVDEFDEHLVGAAATLSLALKRWKEQETKGQSDSSKG